MAPSWNDVEVSTKIYLWNLNLGKKKLISLRAVQIKLRFCNGIGFRGFTPVLSETGVLKNSVFLKNRTFRDIVFWPQNTKDIFTVWQKVLNRYPRFPW